MAKKYTKLYYSITEVGEILNLKPHILRYWETEFPILHPKKNRAGNRAYRKKDIDIATTIKYLLYEEGYTIEGARKKLQWLKEQDINIRTYPQKAAAVANKVTVPQLIGVLREVRDGLQDMRQMLT
ncbi:MAG: MerR family transcriptional regulator [Candidatus Zixiibacteriota bacterium]